MPLKLITDLPVDSHDDAVDKLRWYAMRWKIEVFHKILKSGCRAEQARLRIAERLVRLLAVFCILSWRVFWLTMLNRTELGLEPALVLTEIEINVLDRLIPDPEAGSSTPKTLSSYLIKIARLRRLELEWAERSILSIRRRCWASPRAREVPIKLRRISPLLWDWKAADRGLC